MDLEILKDNSNIRNIVEEIANKYRMKLSPHNASGNLSNFTWKIETPVNHFIVYFDIESYWYFIENGRKPGKRPPIEAIENWINIKPIVPDARSGRVPTTKQLAFLIARSIGENGTQGHHLLKETLDDSEALITAIKQEIAKEIKTFIEDGFYH